MKSDYIHNPPSLKIDLMLRGIRVEEALGEDLTSYASAGPGIDIVLPRSTLVNVPYGGEFTEDSPYVLKRSKKGYVVTDGKEEVPVKLVTQPGFYKRKTTTGKPFSSISTVHGSYVVITPSPRCDFFNRNVECRYCAGNFDVESGKGDITYSVDEVLETAEAILTERASDIIYLSIGFSETDDGGIEFLTPYIKAVKKHFNCLVAVEALPPKKNLWIDETYAVGADSVLYNLEIFDRELFEIICPGRAELVGRQRYIEALGYAAEKVFPNGTVASHLIVGLEPPGSTIRGIDFLTAMGVVPILPIYRPRPEKALRIEPLTTEIIIPVYRHLYRAVKQSNINMNWVRDISTVTTPIESRFLAGETGIIKTLFESFYKSRLGLKAAWGLSTIRRKLRVREEPTDHSGR